MAVPWQNGGPTSHCETRPPMTKACLLFCWAAQVDGVSCWHVSSVILLDPSCTVWHAINLHHQLSNTWRQTDKLWLLQISLPTGDKLVKATLRLESCWKSLQWLKRSTLIEPQKNQQVTPRENPKTPLSRAEPGQLGETWVFRYGSRGDWDEVLFFSSGLSGPGPV